jgi:hypothetical protein
MTDPKAIWQNQTMEENSMITLADIRIRAVRFQSRIRWRNLALYLYSLANIAITLWLISTGKFSRMAQPGLLLAAAHLFVIWQLWWRTSARPLPEDLAGRSALDYHRHELERQRDAMASAWIWYILPFMPGLVWELWLRANLHPVNVPPTADRALVLFLILGALFFWISVWLAFSWAAARLEIRIERLNVLKAE